jgi:hypothetical protein
MSTSTQQSGVKTFRVPRTIIENGSLRTLSGNALSLFLAISFRCYRTRTPDVKFSFKELFLELEQRAKEIDKAVLELRAAGLIHFQQSQNMMFFQIQQPDGSKAKTYLQDRLEPVPKQD